MVRRDAKVLAGVTGALRGTKGYCGWVQACSKRCCTSGPPFCQRTCRAFLTAQRRHSGAAQHIRGEQSEVCAGAPRRRQPQAPESARSFVTRANLRARVRVHACGRMCAACAHALCAVSCVPGAVHSACVLPHPDSKLRKPPRLSLISLAARLRAIAAVSADQVVAVVDMRGWAVLTFESCMARLSSGGRSSSMEGSERHRGECARARTMFARARWMGGQRQRKAEPAGGTCTYSSASALAKRE
jgi:hypothetical protein